MAEAWRIDNNGTGETVSIYDGERVVADVYDDEDARLIVEAVEQYEEIKTAIVQGERHDALTALEERIAATSEHQSHILAETSLLKALVLTKWDAYVGIGQEARRAQQKHAALAAEHARLVAASERIYKTVWGLLDETQRRHGRPFAGAHGDDIRSAMYGALNDLRIAVTGSLIGKWSPIAALAPAAAAGTIGAEQQAATLEDTADA